MSTHLYRTKHPAALCVTGATLLVALSLAGCKGFWDPPTGTSGGTGTTATTTTLTTSSSSVAAGASVNLTATVAPAAATGTVTFYSGTATLGTGTLSSGTATYTATFATAGTESLTATYGGDSTYAASTSNAVGVTVTSAAATAVARAVVGTGAVQGKNLILDPETSWAAPSTLHLHNLARVIVEGSSAVNLEGTHCVLYSGTVFLADGTKSKSAVYDLQGGGYLAPEEKASELGCK